jgi:hypothetical protein
MCEKYSTRITSKHRLNTTPHLCRTSPLHPAPHTPHLTSHTTPHTTSPSRHQQTNACHTAVPSQVRPTLDALTI